MAFSLLFAASHRAEAQFETPLIAGQNYTAGKVQIFILDDVVFVVFDVLPQWQIEGLHLAIGPDQSWFPVNKSGSPKIGNFPYHTEDAIPFESTLGGTSYYFMVPNEWPDAPQICVAAHAVVKPVSVPGVTQSQTAWGWGSPFGNGWATYFCGIKEQD